MKTETRPYTGDPFTISADGHYIGQDGYAVPKDFAEFYEQQPNYVRRWASKWLHMAEEDDEDARRLVKSYVDHYNDIRLNSAIGYITAGDMLGGHQREIFAERDRRLEAAREQRKNRRQRTA